VRVNKEASGEYIGEASPAGLPSAFRLDAAHFVQARFSQKGAARAWCIKCGSRRAEERPLAFFGKSAEVLARRLMWPVIIKTPEEKAAPSLHLFAHYRGQN